MPERARPSEQVLFSGIYGLVLASIVSAALDAPGEASDPGSDALWVLLTAVTAAAAHGYAHVIAQRATGGGAAGTGRLRSVLAEWPLVAAVLPTLVLMLTSLVGWWSEAAAVETALLLNTVALFGCGTWAARTAGRGLAASCRSGGMDMVIGLVVIGANAVIK